MHISADALKTLLTKSGKLSPDLLKQAETIAAQTNEPLDRVLIQRRMIGERELVAQYAASLSLPYVNLANVKIPRELLIKIPERIAKRYQAVIFGQKNTKWQLAMADPEDIQAIDAIEKQLGGAVQINVATTSDILAVLDQYRAGLDTEINQAIKDSSSNEKTATASENVSADELTSDAPIAKTVNIVLESALKARASDIHIEPRENIVQIRYRIDGVLKESMTLPKQLLPAVVSRIKIMANLKIDEHRLPQDGRFKAVIGSKTIAVRVSTLPVMEGEKVVMRLLDETTKAATLEELGFADQALNSLHEAMKQPHGMTLVTGPTGAGKSTTLYSVLTQLNTPGVNISTIEDPVEYRIAGANQTQVNTQAGMTFANGLRALLRQDPNIIMVGEIRDSETANLAVQAALTGHVVLSTLHTNNAATALPRLLDMQIEPFLISTTVNTVVAQRLVRKLCPQCREAYPATGQLLQELRTNFSIEKGIDFAELMAQPAVPTSPTPAVQKPTEEPRVRDTGETRKVIPVPADLNLSRTSILDKIAADPTLVNRPSNDQASSFDDPFDEEFNLPTPPTQIPQPGAAPTPIAATPAVADTSPKTFTTTQEVTLYRAVGCPQCDMTGYTGRMGIYEVLDITTEIAHLITSKATSADIQAQAVKQGMVTMQEDGFAKALQGLTTIEEIMRVTRE
ncbi:type II/IV secretion system protein [bacterium]|nr:type II/IV secretion system protein [bacterium]